MKWISRAWIRRTWTVLLGDPTFTVFDVGIQEVFDDTDRT